MLLKINSIVSDPSVDLDIFDVIVNIGFAMAVNVTFTFITLSYLHHGNRRLH